MSLPVRNIIDRGERGIARHVLVGQASETVSEFFMNPKSCHDTEAETEPTWRQQTATVGAPLAAPFLGGASPAPTAASCYDFGR